MEDRIHLLVRCTVETTHKIIHDAIQEFQNGTTLQVSDTKNVKVLKVEILKMNTQTTKY